MPRYTPNWLRFSTRQAQRGCMVHSTIFPGSHAPRAYIFTSTGWKAVRSQPRASEKKLKSVPRVVVKRGILPCRETPHNTNRDSDCREDQKAIGLRESRIPPVQTR